jgi:thymidylate synthase
MTVSLTGFDQHRSVIADANIRSLVDAAIAQVNVAEGRPAGRKPLIHTVEATATTIFPHSAWTPLGQRSPRDLFDRYMTRLLPRLQNRCKDNRQGTYFGRMIISTGLNRSGQPATVNQLGDLIKWWHEHKVHPPSAALQVNILDPAKDHNGSHQRPFPCLQQVSFMHYEGNLEMGAYYPSQLVFERGYGNYLGLCNLATFMAHQLELELKRVSIVVLRPHTAINRTGPLLDLVPALEALLMRGGACD